MTGPDIPMYFRTVPPAEHPVGIWLAPIKGVFLDMGERWANPFEEEHFSVELEPRIRWRSTTLEDRRHMAAWFDFYREAHAPTEGESISQGSDSVVSPDDVTSVDEQRNAYPTLVAFILALSLHTTAPVGGRVLTFEVEQTEERRVLPTGGYHPLETARFPRSSLQRPLTMDEISAVPSTYRLVVRAFEQKPDNAFLHAVGAYRAAIGSADFMNGIPILMCASLEALAATIHESEVIDRLARRYESASEGRPKIERLYKLRHWFAHGAAEPSMRDAQVRIETLIEGIGIIKAVLRDALVDDELFEASLDGRRGVESVLRHDR